MMTSSLSHYYLMCTFYTFYSNEPYLCLVDKETFTLAEVKYNDSYCSFVQCALFILLHDFNRLEMIRVV